MAKTTDKPKRAYVRSGKYAKKTAPAPRKEAKKAKPAKTAVKAETTEEDEGQVKKRASVIDQTIRDAYGPKQTCGDSMADRLEEADLGATAKQNGVDFSRWSHLNPGMQRMCLGNVLRKLENDGQKVKIIK